MSSGTPEISGNGHRSEQLREAPMGELVKHLAEQTSALVKAEVDLAKAELSEKGARAGKGVGFLGGAGTLALLGAAALTATIIGALDTAMPFWLASLIVTLIYFAAAGVLALQGRDKIREATPPAPQTVETLKEDIEWAKAPNKFANA